MLRLVGEAGALRWRVASLMPLPNAVEQSWLVQCQALLDPATPPYVRAELAEEMMEDMGFLQRRRGEEGEEGGEGEGLPLDVLLATVRPECDRLARAREEYNGGVAVGAVLDEEQVVDLLTRLAHQGHAVIWLFPNRAAAQSGGGYSAMVQHGALWAVQQAIGVRERLRRSGPEDVLSGPDCIWLPSRLRYVARRLRTYASAVTRWSLTTEVDILHRVMTNTLYNLMFLIRGFIRGLNALCDNDDFWDRQVAEYHQFLVEHIASVAGAEEKAKEAAKKGGVEEGEVKEEKGKEREEETMEVEGQGKATPPAAPAVSQIHGRVRRLFRSPRAFSPLRLAL
jgi:hypothetical protein